MHQLARPSALLGGQQALRLQQLQELSDDLVHRTHLQQQRVRPLVSSRRNEPPPPPSRTVEAVLDVRRQQTGATAARLRNKIDDARGSVCTERSERPEAPDRRPQQRRAAKDERAEIHAPLVPQFPSGPHCDPDDSSPDSRCVAAAGADGEKMRPTATRRKIGAVRRRANNPESGDLPRRKLTKQELAWLEKQLQFTQRVAVLERECESWWRQFFSASGVSSGLSSTTAAAIQRGLDEVPSARAQDARHLTQQLQALRAKLARVSHKLGDMRDGETYYADLQQLIEDLEAAIAAFRLAQREQFDEYVTEEKVLEKELSAFAARMSAWEAEPSSEAPRAGSSRSAATRGSSGSGGRRRTTQDRDEDSATEDLDAALEPSPQEADMMARVRRLNELIVQSGGMTGGWDEREHRVFTSLLLRFGLTDEVLVQHHAFQTNQSHHDQQSRKAGDSESLDYESAAARFLQKCIAKVATKSASAVRCHLIWYLDHIQLLQQKKAVIAEWKARKERERQQLLQQGLVGGSEGTENNGSGGSPSPGRLKPGRGDQEGDDEQQRRLLAAKSKAKKDKMLRQWREEKRMQEQEAQTRERAVTREKEAQDAKRKQEQLEAKQKVLLYKLQKEQEAAATGIEKRPNSSRSLPQDGSPNDTPSPVAKEELMERSRQAIEYAKAKRAKLQELEARRRKQSALPARPPSTRTSPTEDDAQGSSRPVLLLQPTKASQARGLSKLELRQMDKERRRLNAHDTFFPGAEAIPDVKVKSFGHLPIQPRAVPAWRRNI